MAARNVPAELIWAIRVRQLEAVLAQPPWVRGGHACASLFALTLQGRAQSNGFTIWNAGKEGKRLYRSLSVAARAAVVAFADVDARKLAQGMYDDMQGRRRIPILHFRCAHAATARVCVATADCFMRSSVAKPPLLLCVKPNLTGDGPGSFEDNLASLQLQEGREYLHFS